MAIASASAYCIPPRISFKLTVSSRLMLVSAFARRHSSTGSYAYFQLLKFLTHFSKLEIGTLNLASEFLKKDKISSHNY